MQYLVQIPLTLVQSGMFETRVEADSLDDAVGLATTEANNALAEELTGLQTQVQWNPAEILIEPNID